MPELPEVETIKRQLSEVLVGQRVKSVEVLREKSFVGNPKKMVGRKIKSIDRKAKLLIVETDEKDVNVLVHLKMTGQLIYQLEETRNKLQDTNKFQISNNKLQINRIVGGHPSADWVKELPSSHTRVVVQFGKGILYFNDMRVFGWVKVVKNSELESLLGRMPNDIIDRGMTAKKFFETLQRSRRAVKLVVMDSQKIGGVGNIYANDGLWKARIDPRREANGLSIKESDRLLKSLKKVIRLGIKLGGATASDDKFVQSTGLGGRYQEHFLTYEREGKKCRRRDRGTIDKVKLGGRGTYFCGKCQA